MQRMNPLETVKSKHVLIAAGACLATGVLYWLLFKRNCGNSGNPQGVVEQGAVVPEVQPVVQNQQAVIQAVITQQTTPSATTTSTPLENLTAYELHIGAYNTFWYNISNLKNASAYPKGIDMNLYVSIESHNIIIKKAIEKICRYK